MSTPPLSEEYLESLQKCDAYARNKMMKGMETGVEEFPPAHARTFYGSDARNSHEDQANIQGQAMTENQGTAQFGGGQHHAIADPRAPHTHERVVLIPTHLAAKNPVELLLWRMAADDTSREVLEFDNSYDAILQTICTREGIHFQFGVGVVNRIKHHVRYHNLIVKPLSVSRPQGSRYVDDVDRDWKRKVNLSEGVLLLYLATKWGKKEFDGDVDAYAGWMSWLCERSGKVAYMVEQLSVVVMGKLILEAATLNPRNVQWDSDDVTSAICKHDLTWVADILDGRFDTFA